MPQTSPVHHDVEAEPQTDFGRFLDFRYIRTLLRRRFFYFAIPFVLLAGTGLAAAALLPAIYLSEGKILVESQRIPTDLVRPTVTSLAAERVQVLEQRLMARDNVMAIVDKYKLFPERRSLFSNTELVELVRERTRIQPIDLGVRRTTADRVAVAFT